MKINPILIGIPVILFALSQKKSVSKVKDSKPVNKDPIKDPVDEIPSGFANGFKLTLCDKLEINDQLKFSLYVETMLKSIIVQDKYKDPSKVSPIDFAKEFINLFSKDCYALFDSNTIETKEQFALIYALFSKGIQYYITESFLNSNLWKKYFLNIVAFDFYVRAATDYFDTWFENVKGENFSAEDYDKLAKIFELKDLPELVDQGFEYNCASVKLKDSEKAMQYFSDVAEFMQAIQKFKDPATIEFMDYVISAFNFMAPNCFALYKNAAMNNQEYVIVYKMFDFLTDAYIANNFKTQEEIAKYKAAILLPQWIFIRQQFANITEAEIEEFDISIEQKGMYP